VFILLSFPILSAVQSNLTTKELLNIMNNEQRVAYELGLRRNVPVTLVIKKGNKLVDPTNLPLSPLIKKVEGNNLEFDSLTSCNVNLKSLGFTIKRYTLSKYIKQGKEFYNFYCKYFEKSLPVDFKYLDLLIEEYKNNKLNIKTIEPVNKKNKPLIVKSIHDNNEQTFFSIMDIIRYFESQGIKLERKTLNKYIKNGGVYFNIKIKR
jgi:hypothetical protein